MSKTIILFYRLKVIIKSLRIKVFNRLKEKKLILELIFNYYFYNLIYYN